MIKIGEDLREQLSDLEHEQWMHWSETLGAELEEIKQLIYSRQGSKAIKKINERLERWKVNWIPYAELTEEIKEYDREWADKVLEIVGASNDP